MGIAGIGRWTAFVLLLAAGVPSEANEKDEALRREYKRLRHKPDLVSGIDRWAALRKIGRQGTKKGATLLRDVAGDKRLPVGERLLAVYELAKFERAWDRLGREDPESPFVVAVARGMAYNRTEGRAERLAALHNKKLAIRTAGAMSLRWAPDKAALPLLTELYEKLCNDGKAIALVHEIVRTVGRLHPRGRDLVDDAAEHADWRVRVAAAEHRPGELLLDEHPAVCATAAYYVARKKRKGLLAKLIDLLERPGLRTKFAAARALRLLSGHDYGLDHTTWRRWLDSPDKNLKGETVSVARYFTLGVYSDRVLFLVDTSGSMAWPDRTPQRIDLAREQLIQAVRGLGTRARFNILGFHGKIQRFRPKKTVPATRKNITAAERWIRESMVLGYGTNQYGALEAAFEHGEMDSIYLLSDGAPNHTPSEAYWPRLEAWNRYRRIPIHTVALTLEKRGEMKVRDADRLADRLRRLAFETGGSFKRVRDTR